MVNGDSKVNENDQTNISRRPAWAPIVLFGSPILLFLGLWEMISLPGMLANPKYDFIYAVCRSYESCRRYKQSITNEDSVVYPQYIIRDSEDSDVLPELYLYSQSTNSAKKIGPGEYANYKLNKATSSPDGYRLQYTESYGVLFSGSTADRWALVKGIASKPVDLEGVSHSYYRGEVELVGWIEQ